MKRLYNQTNKRLSWEMGAKTFSCAPFDYVEIPDDLVDPCRSRGLPLGVTPIAPETKAKSALDAEQEAARKDEFRQLRLELETVQAGERTAKSTAESLSDQLSDSAKTVQRLEQELVAAKDQLRIKTGDHEAAVALLEETGRKLQHAEDWIVKNKTEAIVRAEAETAAATPEAKAKAKAGAPPAK